MDLFGNKRIFLDYAAGADNPSAIYKEGVVAKQKLEEARTRVARLLHVQARDIIFTSGGTESDNLAVLGATSDIKNPHIIISSLEHPAVSECAKEVVRRGGEVTVVEANEEGLVNPHEVVNALKKNTVLVSIIYASGETGTIQHISKIGRLINEVRKEKEVSLPYFHIDATQALAYLNLDVSALHVDMMTLENVLVVRPPVKLRPTIFGGGQEKGLRSGTENVLAIVEFVAHLERAQKNKIKESERLRELRKYFISEIKKIPKAVVNGSEDPGKQLPNIVSISFPGELHEFLVIKLDQKGIMVSTGSSCRSGKNEVEQEALRFSFGSQTTVAELKKTLAVIKALK